MSDGQQLYWMYMLKAAVAHPVLGHKIKRHLVFLQALLLRVHLESETERYHCCYF